MNDVTKIAVTILVCRVSAYVILPPEFLTLD